ncbi:MAG: hypothetical protein IJJ23_11090 [Clostridia bacterium]|nr:hypothetical protein [Clostridia bacterium]
MIGFLMLLLSIAVIAFVVWIQKFFTDRKKAEATESTKGVLVNAYTRDDRHNTWVVSYTVDQRTYSTMIDVNGISIKEMKEHMHEDVTVYYDPSNPQKAWASVPGRSDYDY